MVKKPPDEVKSITLSVPVQITGSDRTTPLLYFANGNAKIKAGVAVLSLPAGWT